MRPDKKRKPLLLIAFLKSAGGGAEKQSALVAEAVKEDFRIALVVSKPVPDYWQKIMEHKGLKVIVLQKRDTLLERRLRNRRLLRVCQELNPDLIYSRFIDFNLTLAKNRGEGNLSCPVIIQEVTTPTKLIEDNRTNRLFYKRRISRHYPRADLILCNGNVARKDLIEHFSVNPDKCFYLPNMLAASDFQPGSREERWSNQNIPLRIISVGRIVRQKNYWAMLEAVKKIRNNVPVYVEIFGDGPLKRKLQKEISRCKLDDTIRLRGFVPNPKAYFSTFDLLVSCSHREGMSNVVLEAMAVGLPVVVTDVSGTRDFITKSSQGIIFTEGDVESLANILMSLAKDRDQLVMLAREGRKRAKNFAVSKIGKKYTEVFLKLL